jgi:N-sulfoglucosamine sulfohydrolase
MRSGLGGALLFSLIFSLMGLLVIGGCGTGERPLPPPNILFITVDDMGWDTPGVYGGEVADITPNIDALADEGMLFEHAHVSIAICQPSRAAFMTGLHPHRSGAMGFEPIRAGVPTLVERLDEAGYRVGIMSKVSHTPPSRNAVWDSIITTEMLNGGRDPAAFGKYARRFFEASKREQRPFLLVANIDDPHFPYAGSRAERVAASQRQFGFTGAPPPLSRTFTPDEIQVPAFLPDLPPVRESLANYYNSAHRADESVGRILNALDAAGLASTTLVVLVSDNGMPVPFAKTNVYPASTRTPWIVRWPGVVAPGSRDSAHVISAVDFAPSVLAVAGLPGFPESDGRSLLPILKGEAEADRDHVFTFLYKTRDERRYPMRAIQGRRYGYIYNAWSDGRTVFRTRVEASTTMRAMREAAKSDAKLADRIDFLDHRVPEEFYDYDEDPSALRNLVDVSGTGQVETSAILERYRALLLDEMEATRDPIRERFEARLREVSAETDSPSSM